MEEFLQSLLMEFKKTTEETNQVLKDISTSLENIDRELRKISSSLEDSKPKSSRNTKFLN